MMGNTINKLKSFNRIVYVTNEPIPDGMAATNRIKSMSLAFLSNNIKPSVISLNINNLSKQKRGISHFEGIEYECIYNLKNKRNKYKIFRAFDYYFKSFFLLIKGWKYFKKNTLIIYYCSENLPAFTLKVISLIKKSILFKEETEHISIRTKHKNKISKLLFIKIHYHLFDGLWVISNSLYSYFIDEYKFRKPIFLMPVIVDKSFFNLNHNCESKKIIYTGTIDIRKEGLDNLIVAMSEITNKFPDYTLHLYGNGPKEDILFFENLIKIYDLKNHVFIQGYIEHNKLKKIISNSSILISVRPDSIQAKYGLSTKIGEYLASGVPTILTLVGENHLFLKDSLNTYICQPTIDSIKNTIINVIQNYSTAIKIGQKGQDTAYQLFNAELIARNFLINVNHINDNYSF